MTRNGYGALEPAGTEMPKSLFGYDVIDFLGEGAGSLIYVVTDPADHQIYALKHVLKRTEKDVRFLQQLQAEFDVASQFTHAGLRRAIELKDNRTLLRKPTEAALVLEMFDGMPLEALPPFDTPAFLECFIRTAEALGALHGMGYIHCDLKPNNILINNEGDVKVIDFGQTCKAGTIKERIQGTPDYISPEQVKRDPVTARTDVFNLGATMYWTATRQTIPTLFKLEKSDNSFLVDDRIPSPRELGAEVPETLSNFIMECVRTNPMRRPEDMPEVTRRLELIRHSTCRRRSTELMGAFAV